MGTRLIGSIVIFIGLSFIVFFGFELLGSDAIKQTIESNRELEKSFHEAAAKIDAYIESTRRLPTADEVRAIDRFMTINLSASEYPKEWEKPPAGAYYLARWTGDRDEFYASWMRKTTLHFEEDQFYIFNSKLFTWILVLAGAGIFSFGLSIFKKQSV